MPLNILKSDLYSLSLNKAKLKAVCRTSTLFSGFAMVTLVEMQIEINNDLRSEASSIVLHLFTLITCLLIGVHLIALMISTCLLPHIESLVQQYEYQMEYDSFYLKQTTPQQEISSYHVKHEFPLGKFQPIIELSWILSNGFGIILFLIQIALVCYIKFSPMTNVKAIYISGWIIVAFILMTFSLFSKKFYDVLVESKLLTKRFEIDDMSGKIRHLVNKDQQKQQQQEIERMDRSITFETINELKRSLSFNN